MKEKPLYAVTHEHEFGLSTFLVRSNHSPSEEEVVNACSIDFEPDKGEVLTISPLVLEEIKELPDRPEAPSDGTVGVD